MSSISYQDHLYVVILCGGGGTRVWPLSVNKKPKQFLNFYSDKTLYQETFERAKRLVPVERIISITNAAYKEEIVAQTPELPVANIIAEPQKRDTALAMGVAAACVHNRDSESVIINLASDHVISNLDLYNKTLYTAASIAFDDHLLVSVGIVPTFPHPGFGYIHKGEELKRVNELSVNTVAAFKEKPDVETAKAYLETGNYLWNANNYIWRADSILEEFDRLSPEIATQIRAIKAALNTDQEELVYQQAYQVAPKEPIDTAISEKTQKLVVVPGEFGWHDIGGWKVVYDLGEKDVNQNVIIHHREAKTQAPVLLHHANQNLVYAGSQAIGIVGLSKIVVVDTGNGLLICDREASNDVKKIVEIFEANHQTEYI